MELGRLTLLCMNLVCVGTIVSLVFVLFISMRPPAKKQPRTYSEPPLQQHKSIFESWRKPQENTVASEENRRIEV